MGGMQDEKPDKKADRKDYCLDYDCASRGNRNSSGGGYVCDVRTGVLGGPVFTEV